MPSIRLALQVSQALQLVGGATKSIFPQVEALLLTGNYAQALDYFAGRKNQKRYLSLMDFFFCELNPEYRYSCRRYYAGMGKPLRELLDTTELMEHNRRLLVALEVAIQGYKEKQQADWGWYRSEVEMAAFAA